MAKRAAIWSAASIIGLAVVFLIGYSSGYKSAFKLQNANAYSSNVAFVATLIKAEKLLANNEVDRANLFIRRSLSNEKARLSDYKMLSVAANRFIFPQLSEIALSDKIMKDASSWEEAIVTDRNP